MYDNREIAQKALQRAAEIKAENKRRHRIIQNGTVVGVLSAVMVFAMVLANGTDDTQYTVFEDTKVPLAQAPIANEIVCEECEEEPEENRCELCK